MCCNSYKTLYKNKKNGSAIRQDKDSISLYFSQDILQSRMWLKTPEKLSLSYTRYMLFPLIKLEPQNILLIGLGGGSFVRFFNHFFPNCKVTVVENCQEVIDLALEFFKVDPQKCHIHNGCGYDFICESDDQYDLILVDAFDNRGMAPKIYSNDFFNQCLKHLTNNGAVSCNTWGQNKALFAQVANDFLNSFHSLAKIPVPNRGNNVLISFPFTKDYKTSTKRSIIKNLEKRLGLEFAEIIKFYNRANMSLWQNFAGKVCRLAKR